MLGVEAVAEAGRRSAASRRRTPARGRRGRSAGRRRARRTAWRDGASLPTPSGGTRPRSSHPGPAGQAGGSRINRVLTPVSQPPGAPNNQCGWNPGGGGRQSRSMVGVQAFELAPVGRVVHQIVQLAGVAGEVVELLRAALVLGVEELRRADAAVGRVGRGRAPVPALEQEARCATARGRARGGAAAGSRGPRCSGGRRARGSPRSAPSRCSGSGGGRRSAASSAGRSGRPAGCGSTRRRGCA